MQTLATTPQGNNLIERPIVVKARQITLDGTTQVLTNSDLAPSFEVTGNVSLTTVKLPQNPPTGMQLTFQCLGLTPWVLDGNGKEVNGSSSILMSQSDTIEYIEGYGWISQSFVSAALQSQMTALESKGIADSVRIMQYVFASPGTGTITTALAAITTASASNWVCLFLAPGTYIDAVDLTAKPWIMICGTYGSAPPKIYDNSQTHDTILQSGSKNILANLWVVHDTLNGETYKYALHADGTTISGVDTGWLYCYNCLFQATSSDGSHSSKAAFGSRVYSNQWQGFLNCRFESDGLYAIYINDATTAQSSPGEYLFNTISAKNSGDQTTAYGLLYTNGSSGQQAKLTFIDTIIKGGANATADFVIQNAGSDTWIAVILTDGSNDFGTTSIGSTHIVAGGAVSPRFPQTTTRTEYQGDCITGANGAAILANGQANATRFNLYVVGGSGPYFYNNSGTLTWINSAGTVILQPSGVFAVQAGYLQANSGVQSAFLGPMTYGSQTVSSTPATLGYASGGRNILCTVDGGTLNLPPAVNANQEFIIVYDPGAAAGSPLTINGNGKTINGAASITVTDRYSVRVLQYIGGQWYISASVGS